MKVQKQNQLASKRKVAVVLVSFAVLTSAIKVALVYVLSQKLSREGFPLGLVDSDYEDSSIAS